VERRAHGQVAPDVEVAGDELRPQRFDRVAKDGLVVGRLVLEGDGERLGEEDI
jgi:hypothetical protein